MGSIHYCVISALGTLQNIVLQWSNTCYGTLSVYSSQLIKRMFWVSPSLGIFRYNKADLFNGSSLIRHRESHWCSREHMLWARVVWQRALGNFYMQEVVNESSALLLPIKNHLHVYALLLDFNQNGNFKLHIKLRK